ncbi:MAG: hypothetical protein ACTSSK_13015 [Candidatus Heimdallarchaeota archaeon]
MTDLIGRYIDFNTKNTKKPSKSSSEKNQSIVEGENTIATISVIDKGKSRDSTRIRDHAFEWLKVKGKCPVCKQSLRPGGTEEVKL